MQLCRAALGTGFTFAMTALGAASVFLLQRETARGRRLILGFAAGIMTAASVWSLLLPALEQAAEGTLPPWVSVGGGLWLGTLFLLVMDGRAGCFCPDGTSRHDALLLWAITLHNIPEGMAVGLACAWCGDQPSAAAALALGIGLQNLPEGAAVSLPLRQAGWSRRRAFRGGALSGAVEPLFGLLTVLAASAIRSLMPWLLSFAAGAMLYAVAEELIPRAHSREGTLGYLGGFALMMLLDTALGA